MTMGVSEYDFLPRLRLLRPQTPDNGAFWQMIKPSDISSLISICLSLTPYTFSFTLTYAEFWYGLHFFI